MTEADDLTAPPILEALEREGDDAARRVERYLEEMLSAADLARLDAMLEGS